MPVCAEKHLPRHKADQEAHNFNYTTFSLGSRREQPLVHLEINFSSHDSEIERKRAGRV